jgi:hypothetical protein
MSKFKKLMASALTLGLLLSSISMASANYFGDVAEGNIFAPYINHGVEQGYFTTSNENFYPNNNLSRAELAKIAVIGSANEELTEVVETEHTFADVPADDMFAPYIYRLLAEGVISANEYYNPSDSVTRAEAAKILVNAFDYELDATGGPTFSDVEADNIFYLFVETAANNGLVNGYGDGNFGPNNNITRAEAAKVLAMATGYTGEWGELAGIELSTSSDTVAPGGSLEFTVKVVDDAGLAVKDYEGNAYFEVSTGRLAKKEIAIANGLAKATYTAPGYGSRGTVVVKVGEYEVEKNFSVVLPEDQRMMLYAVDYNINTSDNTILYLTISDEEGRPVNGRTNKLSFDVVDGDATIANVAQFPGGADGIYRAVLTTDAAATGVNVIEVTDTESGETSKVEVVVSEPGMEVYLLDPAISVYQATTALVYLTQGDGSPILNAHPGGTNTLRASFLNANLGTVGVVNQIGDGWYSVALTAKDKTADAAKVKFTYTGVTPNRHEYKDLEIAPYNMSMEIIGKDVNSLNGESTVVLSFTDVNGQPVTVGAGQAINPINDISLDVITAARYEDPSGNTTFTLAADWSYSHGGANGIAVTQITACGVGSANCTIDDSDIEVVARLKSASNEVVTISDTLSFSHPRIDDVLAFEDNRAANDRRVVLMATVMDDQGAGVDGLVAADFLIDTVAANSIENIGGGLYVIESVDMDADDDDVIDVTSVTLVLGNTNIHEVNVEIERTNTDYVLYGQTSVAEGVAGAVNRSGVAVARLVGGVLNDAGAPVVGAEEDPIDVVTGADVSVRTGVYAYVITAGETDEVEIANVQVAGVNTTFSVRPIKLRHTSVDTNGKVTEVAYGFLKALDQYDRLIDILAVANITVDTDGSISDAEVTGGNIAAFAAPIPGLYGTRFLRAATNKDTDEMGTVTYELRGDDESLYVDTWEFLLVNPSYETYLQNPNTYVAPNSVVGNAGTLNFDALNAIAVVAVVRNDQGVAYNTAAGTNIRMEVDKGDGILSTTYNGAGRPDTVNMANPATGVYTANFLPEDDEEEGSSVKIYPSWDNKDESMSFELSITYPEAQVVVFPTKIDPDKTNNEATVFTIVRDNFGNAVNNLVFAQEDILVEIEGDQQLTSSLNNGGANTIYYGKYTTDRIGTHEVVAKYNDDQVVYEGEIVVEMFKR